jgi:hypothetical protein
MSDDTKNLGDDEVIDDSSDSNTATTTGLGMSAAAHDQNTIFQQNNALQHEFAQQLLEVRRQNVAMFELRLTQANQLFANQIATEQANRAVAESNAASARETAQTNANSQAATQQMLSIKLSGGVFLP